MTVWYSRKPIRLGARGDEIFHRITADQVAEFRRICVHLSKLPKGMYYPESCKIGEAAISRQSGRPLVHVHSSYVGLLEEELEAVEIPDGYLEIQIYRLKRQFALHRGEETMKIRKYFQKKLGALARELKLGRLRADGVREPPDVIRWPDELDDSTEDDEQAYVDRVKRRVSQVKILNSQIENLDLGQRSPLNLTSEPTEKELTRYQRKSKLEKAAEREVSLPTEEEIQSKPWLKAAQERGWVVPDA